MLPLRTLLQVPLPNSLVILSDGSYGLINDRDVKGLYCVIALSQPGELPCSTRA